jgi:transposase-like protein
MWSNLKEKIMERKNYSEEFKKKIVRLCDSTKERGETVGDVLEKYNVASSLLCNWRKKFNSEKTGSEIIAEAISEIPTDVMREFGVDPCGDEIELQEETEDGPQENGCIIINDEMRRESVATALFMSGYTIWQTVENGQYFINFQKD